MSHRTLRSAVAAVLLSGTLTSCRTLRPEPTPGRDAAVAPAYTLPDAGGGVRPAAWWEEFESGELHELIAAALAGNPGLDQYAARLRQAEAAADQARARLFPEMTGGGSAGWSRRRPAGGTGDAVSTESYGLNLAASYEVDLWGRIRAGSNSAGLAARASREDLETAEITLAGEVADRWLQRVEARAQIRLLQSQIETNRRTLDLLKVRTVRTGTPILDFYQQEQVLRASEALLPQAELQAELLGNELALLAGRPLGAFATIGGGALPELPPLPRAGLPADLLMQRPDVRAGWLRVEAAAWSVAAARADRLPALRLTGGGGFEDDALAGLFDDWLANLAAGLTGPILDGGRREAEVRRARAVLDERLAAYRQTVLRAVVEVDNAILGERRIVEQLAALRRQLESAGRTLEESKRRYVKGAIDYLPVLTAQRSLEQLQRSELTVRRSLLSTRVALYRALGGGWNDGEDLTP